MFGDPRALYGEDKEHSTLDEHRQVVTGTSDRQRVLTAVFTEREVTLQSTGTKQVVIRIITAARATRSERRDYEEK